MATHSTTISKTKSAVSRFQVAEKYVACSSAVGEVYDYPVTQVTVSKPSLGPFLKPEVIGKEVPYEYLLTDELPIIFRMSFSGAQNWNFGKDIYCFPISNKDIKIYSWYERLAFNLGKKCEFLGISHLIKISLTSMEINAKVCAALLFFWNSSMNCFMFPEGPMTITLEDIYFLTGCSVYGEPLRLHPQPDDRFNFILSLKSD